jgi:hypothetical protein
MADGVLKEGKNRGHQLLFFVDINSFLLYYVKMMKQGVNVMFELVELYEDAFRFPKIRKEYEEYLDRLADEYDYVKSLEMDNINITSTV